MSEPGLVLVDARRQRVDDPGLRRIARRITAASGARFNSRSYRFPFAVAAWHEAPLGVDIEREQEFDPEFAATVCTEAELIRLGEVADRSAFLASVWAGKEALAKALGDPLAYAPQRLESPEVWPRPAAGRWRARRLDVPPGHRGWLCWRDP